MSKSSRAAFSRTEQDVERMSNAEGWPYWPVLPIKRSHPGSPGQMETAWITADFPSVVLREHPTTRGVLLQMRWELTTEEMDELGFFDPRRLFGPETEQFYREQIVKSYHDVWAVVDDGWMVD